MYCTSHTKGLSKRKYFYLAPNDNNVEDKSTSPERVFHNGGATTERALP